MWLHYSIPFTNLKENETEKKKKERKYKKRRKNNHGMVSYLQSLKTAVSFEDYLLYYREIKKSIYSLKLTLNFVPARCSQVQWHWKGSWGQGWT